jgi:hypothetical protein
MTTASTHITTNALINHQLGSDGLRRLAAQWEEESKDLLRRNLPAALHLTYLTHKLRQLADDLERRERQTSATKREIAPPRSTPFSRRSGGTQRHAASRHSGARDHRRGGAWLIRPENMV